MESFGQIFNVFCKFVDERIFSEENKGAYVAFVIDQTFIDDFCKVYKVKESRLMSAIRVYLMSDRRDDLYVKGIVAIQLFAASKRANDGKVTEQNYRDRLSQVLTLDLQELDKWMMSNQDRMWESLYDWCDRNFFQITKCEKRTGTGRYVQYPINQALRVFTEEDLRYIASCFIEKNLSPKEDIQKRDFKKIISNADIKYCIQTNHARLVIENSIREKDYYDQVFNYFLRWNGEYKDRNGKSHNAIKNNTEPLFLYLSEDDNFNTLELRTENLSLKKKFDLSTTSYKSLSESYNFKRKGIILFKHDDIYDSYWQETRYIEGDDQEGLVICYDASDNNVRYTLRPYLVCQNRFVQIFRIKHDYSTRIFYTKKRIYELYGGLKIGRQIYLKGATPILRLYSPTRIWIDGKAYRTVESEGDIFLDDLDVGRHYLKIQDYKRFEFEIRCPSDETKIWIKDYNQWIIDRYQNSWESRKFENGVVGLDFSAFPQKQIEFESSVLRRWCDMLTFGKGFKNETNKTLQILKRTVI